MPRKKRGKPAKMRRIGPAYDDLRREVALRYGFRTWTAVDQFIAVRYREYEAMISEGRKTVEKASEALFGSGGFR